jgi:glucosylceramidase
VFGKSRLKVFAPLIATFAFGVGCGRAGPSGDQDVDAAGLGLDAANLGLDSAGLGHDASGSMDGDAGDAPGDAGLMITAEAGRQGPGPTGAWITTGDRSSLLERAPAPLSFGTTASTSAFVDVDPTQTFQSIEGFGFTLTGGSASVIAGLGQAAEEALLQELYGDGPNDIGLSVIRLSIGASDMSASDFTYDDVAAGQTDAALAHFSIAPEEAALVPVLKAILAIQPGIKILATPWSAPAWMKDSASFTGGSLLSQYYDVYAQYFVRYVAAMQARGVPIDAVTPQNEPLNANNDPSMTMSSAEEAKFIGQNLGPAFRAANLPTKIIAYDHNCDMPSYPIAVLGDSTANPFIDGSAFHLYAGDITALTMVHDAYPTKNVYFTEQFTASTGTFAGDLDWHEKNVVIGSMRNWGRTALEWALATDATYGPHTKGGCATCEGAVTIAPSVTRNVGYYVIAHASKFVPPGSVQIASTQTGNLNSAAFRTPAGQTVLVIENDGGDATFNIRVSGLWAAAALVGGAVATYVW